MTIVIDRDVACQNQRQRDRGRTRAAPCPLHVFVGIKTQSPPIMIAGNSVSLGALWLMAFFFCARAGQHGKLPPRTPSCAPTSSALGADGCWRRVREGPRAPWQYQRAEEIGAQTGGGCTPTTTFPGPLLERMTKRWSSIFAKSEAEFTARRVLDKCQRPVVCVQTRCRVHMRHVQCPEDRVCLAHSSALAAHRCADDSSRAQSSTARLKA